MKRILLLIAIAAMTLSVHAQLVSSKTPQPQQGNITFVNPIGAAALPDGTDLEGIIIEGELIEDGVLIQELRYSYDAYGETCIESMQLADRRFAPLRKGRGLVAKEYPPYDTTKIVTVTFVPDKDKTHWVGSYAIGRIPSHETCEVTLIGFKCIKKEDFQMHLIESKE